MTQTIPPLFAAEEFLILSSSQHSPPIPVLVAKGANDLESRAGYSNCCIIVSQLAIMTLTTSQSVSGTMVKCRSQLHYALISNETFCKN